jgi:hypothetical protein
MKYQAEFMGRPHGALGKFEEVKVTFRIEPNLTLSEPKKVEAAIAAAHQFGFEVSRVTKITEVAS